MGEFLAEGAALLHAPSSMELLTFLSSLQLADSFFPSGLYTLSHGLESFAQAGLLKPATLEALLTDYLRHGVGPADGAALACAHRAAETDDLDMAVQADLRLTAVKLPREARTNSQRAGRQLVKTASGVFGGDALLSYARMVERGNAPGNHAIALGLTMATQGIDREHAVAGELYAFSASAVGSAVRLAVIDHHFAQVVLNALKPVIAQTARTYCLSNIKDIASSAPLIDIMAMRHEHAELRLFAS